MKDRIQLLEFKLSIYLKFLSPPSLLKLSFVVSLFRLQVKHFKFERGGGGDEEFIFMEWNLVRDSVCEIGFQRGLFL